MAMGTRPSLAWVAGALLGIVIGGGSRPAATTAAERPVLIIDATVIDGTGASVTRGAVRIEGERIAAIGDLEPAGGDLIVDGAGLVLAPGFVDTHSHADDGIFEKPDALAAVSQGITTVVVGMDGESPHPLADFFARLERRPPAVNVASFAGHGTLRSLVMDEDFRRKASRREVRRMCDLLRREMEAGALGLGTGLEYDPGIYSETSEVIRLARTAASMGGRYSSHIRSEDRKFWAAIDEIIQIGREVDLPVQISHIKLAMRSSWGEADRLIRILDAARADGVNITADIYPYRYWESTLTVLFPDRDFDSIETAKFVLQEIVPPDGLRLTVYDPEPTYVGRTLAQIAEARGVDPAEALLDLISASETMRLQSGRDVESVVGTSMVGEDVERLLVWPHTNICTDGGLDGDHPRGFGSFTRVLGRYVRERGVVSLEEAVRKMSALAAEHAGIAERGIVRPGWFADLVLFDPEIVVDRASLEEPHAVSEGIRTVWVNGVPVYDDGRATGRRSGRVIRRPQR